MGDSSSNSSDWRGQILSALRSRNARESEPFRELLALHAKVREQALSLQQENSRLNFEVQKLASEGGVPASPAGGAHAGSGGSGSQDSDPKMEEMKAKLYLLQEELTELLRRKGENAQQVIDLTTQVKTNEKDLNEKAKTLLEQEDKIEKLQAEVERLKSDVYELEQTNQLLKDEFQTLTLTLNATEKKLVDVQKENDRLIVQVIELKDKDVQRMNEENDSFKKKQADKIKMELEEAANEHKIINLGSAQAIGSETLDSLMCYTVRIPNRAYIRFDAHESDVNAIKWSPHGTVVATGGADRKIKLWDVSKGVAENKGILTSSNGSIMSLDFDAGASLLLASSADFAARVWSLDDMRLRHTLTGHSSKVLAAKFMSEKTKVCTGSHDRTIRVWDLRSKACISTFLPASSCNDLVCLDNLIISGHFDKKIRIYDTRSGPQPTSEIQCNGRITSVDLSRTGQNLLACTRDDSLVLMDLRLASAPPVEYRDENFKVGCDWTRAVFTPDSEYVSVGSGDGSVYIWNVRNPNRPETVLKEHSNVVVAVAWQPAGNCVTTCDKGKEVIVWADI